MKILTPNLVLESAAGRGTPRLLVKATESGRNSRGFEGMDFMCLLQISKGIFQALKQPIVH